MTTQDLKSKHTRLLLSDLASLRAEFFYEDSRQAHTADQLTDLKDRIAAVKAELATREHIPNKQQARAIRQLRAKNRP